MLHRFYTCESKFMNLIKRNNKCILFIYCYELKLDRQLHLIYTTGHKRQHPNIFPYVYAIIPVQNVLFINQYSKLKWQVTIT